MTFTPDCWGTDPPEGPDETVGRGSGTKTPIIAVITPATNIIPPYAPAHWPLMAPFSRLSMLLVILARPPAPGNTPRLSSLPSFVHRTPLALLVKPRCSALRRSSPR